jgi:hypothetical protein
MPYTVVGYRAKQVRDNLHADDLLRAFWCFFERPRVAEVYNIGGGRESNCSMLEAINLVERVTGRPLQWSYDDTNRIGDHIWWISDIRKFQSRRSLLTWKIFGKRLDGFSNDDHPSETKPGERSFSHRGKEVPVEKARARYDLDYLLGLTGFNLKPRHVLARTWTVPKPFEACAAPGSDAETHLTALVTFENGAVLQYERCEFAAQAGSETWRAADAPFMASTS